MSKVTVACGVLATLLCISIILNLVYMLVPIMPCPGLHHDLYDLCYSFQKLCHDADAEYIGCAGTLLGTVRHGSIIPWDDDIDVMMTRANMDKLQSRLVDTDFVLQTFVSGLYKFIHKSKKHARIYHGCNIAFIDVFESKMFDGRFVYSNPLHRSTWPNEFIPEEELYPLATGKFGLLEMPLPREYLAYCERAFGQNWRVGKMYLTKSIMDPIGAKRISKIRFGTYGGHC